MLTLALVRSINKSGIRREDRERVKFNTLKPGDTAPDFVAFSLNREKVTLKSYLGKPVFFIFVSSQCGACKERIQDVEKVIPFAKRAGVEIVYVSYDEIEETKSYFSQVNGSGNIIIIPKENDIFLKNYKIPGTPYYFFINSEGKIQNNGFFDQEWTSLVLQWVNQKVKNS
jgi:thiol-disulfide isomerase/thioredoxin